ncbi:plasmid mobilization protein [Klebsiella pneumoniae]|nr:plasmid mobilization protein [Klebsiella pneumoniae]EIW8489803.1 plasmid mobilization protein [Klebsiella pneumoniae]PLP26805.1 plasmid mobilization protein [Klebsiella pneumoniae]
MCSEVKFISCVSGGFSVGLLPVLPFCRQKRPERVLAVRVMRRYGK